MKHAVFILVVAFTMTLISSSVFARANRVNQVPHGQQMDCEGCHISGNNGLNDFGFDSFTFTQNGNVDWGELSQLDSDRDGYSNGFELGDPNGTWNPGNGNPAGGFTHPADRAENPCGNGAVDGPEQCDGSVSAGDTCGSLGLGTGTLGCGVDCTFETSNCDACGDGAINTDYEQCDGTNLNNETCESLEWDGGTLSCNQCRFDTSSCTGVNPNDPTADNCGDMLRQTNEQCDGDDIGSQTCLLIGYDGGVLSCEDNCTLNLSGCFGGSVTDPDNPDPDDPDNTGNGNGNPANGDPANGDYEDSEINLSGDCGAGGLLGLGMWLTGLMFGFGRRRERR